MSEYSGSIENEDKPWEVCDGNCYACGINGECPNAIIDEEW